MSNPFFEWNPIRIGSLSTVQPFTYRDNITYLQKLEQLAQYMGLLRDKVNELAENHPISELADAVNTKITEVVAAVNAQVVIMQDAMSAHDKEMNDDIRAFKTEISGQITAQDAAIAFRVNALNDLLASKKIELDATVDRANSLFNASNAHLTQAVTLYEDATKQYELAQQNDTFVRGLMPRIDAIESNATDLASTLSTTTSNVTKAQNAADAAKATADAAKTTADKVTAKVDKRDGVPQQVSINVVAPAAHQTENGWSGLQLWFFNGICILTGRITGTGVANVKVATFDPKYAPQYMCSSDTCIVNPNGDIITLDNVNNGILSAVWFCNYRP